MGQLHARTGTVLLNGMIVEPLHDGKLLRFGAIAELPGCTHAITVKPWNMACHCGPDAGAAVERRRTVCDALDLPFERLTCAEQVHGCELAVVDVGQAGAGRDGRASAIAGVDGLLTDQPGIGLMLLSADCPLVLVCDPGRPAVGVAHASWRGTVSRISQHLANRMIGELGCKPADLWAGIGPSAGPECYVVGDDVRQQAAASLDDPERYFQQTPGGMTFDLWSANRDQLLAAGLRSERIEVAGISTIRDDRFFSYRREGPETGRFALVAGVGSS